MPPKTNLTIADWRKVIENQASTPPTPTYEPYTISYDPDASGPQPDGSTKAVFRPKKPKK